MQTQADDTRVLYFVVEVDDGFEIWEKTSREIYQLIRADPSLDSRLDQRPFSSRAEAEARKEKLVLKRNRSSAASS